MCDGSPFWKASALPRCSHPCVYLLLLLTKGTQGEEEILSFLRRIWQAQQKNNVEHDYEIAIRKHNKLVGKFRKKLFFFGHLKK